jgi:hypothetical protein
MWTRRRFLTQGSAAVLGVTAPGFASQLDDTPPDTGTARDLITRETQLAVDRGLAFLANRQQSDGTFGGPYDRNRGNVGITSLAALALLAGGHQPGRGPHGKVVTRALEYILKQEQLLAGERGFLYRPEIARHVPMYSHGFGTLFLAEVHGMVHEPELRQRLRATLRRAVNLILRGQNHEGGWRYNPESSDADASVTACQIMALRAARNAGLSVPKKTVDRCVAYLRSLQQFEGGFRYMHNHARTTFALTAACIVSLNCAGIYRDPAIDAGLKYLLRNRPHVQRSQLQWSHYFYGHYYAVQAMWTAGGPYWAEWYPSIRDELLKHPDRNRTVGYWADPQYSEDYATAMACIVLQIPNNYLPILQK